MNEGDKRRARVFVSCGQGNDEERNISSEIEFKLAELGYDPYVAINRRSTLSVLQNILDMLERCEYYLFVDFKREQLIVDSLIFTKDKEKRIVHRGSLFSNQELAVAIYLKKPLIAFQEDGVKDRDGMLSAIQGNVITFGNRKGLVNNIIDKVKAEWINNWRNEIIFNDQKGELIPPESVLYRGYNARFFHISVRNLHRNASARNCIVYLESYKILDRTISEETNSRLLFHEPVELKWKGMMTQSVLIPPNTNREFDALFLYDNLPCLPHIGVNSFLVDLTDYSFKLRGVGSYELNFIVYSDNFPAIRSTYVLEVGQELSKTRFYRKQK